MDYVDSTNLILWKLLSSICVLSTVKVKLITISRIFQIFNITSFKIDCCLQSKFDNITYIKELYHSPIAMAINYIQQYCWLLFLLMIGTFSYLFSAYKFCLFKYTQNVSKIIFGIRNNIQMSTFYRHAVKRGFIKKNFSNIKEMGHVLIL